MTAPLRGALLYEGKAKKVYLTDNPAEYLVEYKDDATALNGQKRAVISGKGVLNNQISACIFQLIGQAGIPHHFIRRLSERECLVHKLDIFPLEVVVRNSAAGSICRRLGVEEGREFRHPILELYLKNDALHDPLVNDDHVSVLELASPEQLRCLKALALKTNQVLQPWFRQRGILLVDFKLEMGKNAAGQIMVGDEISPDTCRFWDHRGRKLDKDRFRQDMGGLIEAYSEILTRVEGGEKQ